MNGERRTATTDPARIDTTRYEQLATELARGGQPLAEAFAVASRTAREHTPATTSREVAIRDVAAGVAAPALVGFVLWILADADRRGLDRLCFLARDAQVFHSIAEQLVPRLGLDLDLRYVYSSRRTWSLAAADTDALEQQDWLFNSFIRSNAADVCARLGLPYNDFKSQLHAAGVSLDPETRADQPAQAAALRKFASLPDVAGAVTPRIQRMHQLVHDYAIQEHITSTSTGLVDAGWTGRMIAALTRITADLPQPTVYFWGHEPRATGWSDPRLTAWMYDTGTGAGMDLRVPDTPYIIESFGMSDHGITADYRRDDDGTIRAIPETPDNPPVDAWGFKLYRATIHAFCEALEIPSDWRTLDTRPVVSQLLQRFWITPTPVEADTWGAYPYDSDPLARGTRPLARAFTADHLQAVLAGAALDHEDRAWLQGSLALSGALGGAVAHQLTAEYAELGGPATD